MVLIVELKTTQTGLNELIVLQAEEQNHFTPQQMLVTLCGILQYLQNLK